MKAIGADTINLQSKLLQCNKWETEAVEREEICSSSLHKTAVSFMFTRLDAIKKVENNNCWQGCREVGNLVRSLVGM